MDAVRIEGSKLEGLRTMTRDLSIPGNSSTKPGDKAVTSLTEALTGSFETAMNNDLDTPSAIEGIFETVQRLHLLHKDGKIGREQTRVIEEKLRKADSVLQVLY